MECMESVFAKRLKARRQELGMTQAMLGEAVQYSEKAISKWESGNAIPSVKVLLRLAHVLGTDINTLLDYQTKPSFYLGIDGGATKTAFALADEAGHVIRTLQLGACNPFDLGMKGAQELLQKGIQEICTGIATNRVSMFAGISGGGSAGNKGIFAGFFEQFGFTRFANDTDAENALAVGLHGNDGIAVIIGTGSVVYVMKAGERDRIGGYGYLFDKGGSGFDIGRDGVLAALKAADGSGKTTALLQMVEKQLGGSPVDHLSDFYQNGKAYMASFAQLVFEAAAHGDAIAGEILQDSYENLAKHISAGRKNFLQAQPVKVSLVGGLTNYESMIRPILEKQLEGQNVQLAFCKQAPVIGALLLAGAPIDKMPEATV